MRSGEKEIDLEALSDIQIVVRMIEKRVCVSV